MYDMKNINTAKSIKIFIVSYIKNWILPPILLETSKLRMFSTNKVIKSDNHFIPSICCVKKLKILIITSNYTSKKVDAILYSDYINFFWFYKEL